MSKDFLLTFVFYLNVKCIQYTFIQHMLLHIKKHYFIYFFFVSSKAFSVSLARFHSDKNFMQQVLKNQNNINENTCPLQDFADSFSKTSWASFEHFKYFQFTSCRAGRRVVSSPLLPNLYYFYIILQLNCSKKLHNIVSFHIIQLHVPNKFCPSITT